MIKKILTLCVFSAVFCLGCSADKPSDNNGTSEGDKPSQLTVSISSYNVLGNDVKTTWASRKEAIGEIILQEDHQPDIFCLQECHNSPMNGDMKNAFKDVYDYSENTYKTASARLIFWNREKFKKVTSGSLDLLPSKGSSEFLTNRYAHYVLLEDIETGLRLIVYNVHLKVNSSSTTYENERYEQAQTVAESAITNSETRFGAPAVICGDFNCRHHVVINGVISPTNYLKSKGFKDCAMIASKAINVNWYTYGNDMTGSAVPAPGDTGRIDYMMIYSKNGYSVDRYRTVINFTDESTGKIATPVPSDHNPINSIITFKY